MDRRKVMEAARKAARHSYSPYSGFAVGAALLFSDGTIVTGTNVENASYGLTLCAETVAAAKAMAEGRRDGLEAVAIAGPDGIDEGAWITPCGRCRQVLHELATLGGSDPLILCVGGGNDVREIRLSVLLPDAFGPGSSVSQVQRSTLFG